MRPGSGTRRRSRLLVPLGLIGFVAAVYVVVVLGGGALLGRTASPSLPLSLLATVVVALGVAPVQARLAASAGGRPSPYDVLRGTATLTGAEATAELPARMARVLAEGTGVAWAQVWVSVRGELGLAAAWPVDGDRCSPVPGAAADPAGRRALSVRHGGRLLAVLRLQERPGQPLTAVEERLFTGLAAQAGLVLQRVALRAELAARHEELAARTAELRASRQRLIETQDAERRRLERDIHDGAQQHLVALAVNLRLAETLAGRAPDRAAAVLAEQAGAARQAITTLLDLSRGIYPRELADEGLVAAVRAAVTRSPVPVVVADDGLGRLPSAVETALYFFVMEAVQNAGKHSGAGAVHVHLAVAQGCWQARVADDGHGFDPAAPGPGSGLANLRDRLDAVAGTLSVSSGPTGTCVVGRVPVTAAVPRQAAGRKA